MKKTVSRRNQMNNNAAMLFVLLVFLFNNPGMPAVSAENSAAPLTQAASGEDAAECDASRTVQVSGSAQINIIPDKVTIQLGVQSNGGTTDEVQHSNSAAIERVFRALRGQGVADKDIATAIYVVEPVYENYDSLFIKGYRINNVVEVTLREINKTSALISAALKAGANQVIQVEFSTSNLRAIRDQARDLAVKAAQEKARDLAAAAGEETGCVLQISENSWSSYRGWWGGSGLNNWSQNVIQNAAPAAGSTIGSGEEPISLGQIAVHADVTATFALR
jgi:uncharacterized protein YggE